MAWHNDPMTTPSTTRPPWLDRSLFIVGTGRSGTTLLLSLLDAHPGLICWPDEFAYYTAWEAIAGQGGPAAAARLADRGGSEFFGTRFTGSRVTSPYSLEAIDRAAFDRALEPIDPPALGRAGTLEALMTALAESLPKRDTEPDAYVV
jgi:hypothetical protein